MRPDEKEFLGNVLKMSGVAAFAHLFVEVPLHEYGHYWTASWLGAPMYLDGSRVIWATDQVVPPATHGLILLAGGLCAGVLLLILYAIMKAPYRHGLLPLVAANLAYAPLDATQSGDALGLVALVGVWAAIFTTYVARFLGWTPPWRFVARASSRVRGALGFLRMG